MFTFYFSKAAGLKHRRNIRVIIVPFYHYKYYLKNVSTNYKYKEQFGSAIMIVTPSE